MSENAFITTVRASAARRCFTVAFPDAEDARVLKAALLLRDRGIASPVLVGEAAAIRKTAGDAGLDLAGVEIADPAASPFAEEFAGLLFEKRKAKGMTPEQAAGLVRQPLYFAGLMLDTDRVKVVVGGNVSSTGDVIRAAIHTVGVAPGISIVSSYFIMVLPDGRMLCFADCAVNPDPNEAQLADIAISSAKNFQAVTGLEPRVAMLSFSTFGNPPRQQALPVREATGELDRMRAADPKAVDFEYDGEMSAEVALDADLMRAMYPFCRLSDAANVLVMPGLHSANLTSQVMEKLGGGTVIGPLLVGLSKPAQIVPLGATVSDLVNTAALAAYDSIAAKR